MSPSEGAEIGGVRLNIERIQSLCCSDVRDAEMDVVEGAGVVDNISEPILAFFFSLNRVIKRRTYQRIRERSSGIQSLHCRDFATRLHSRVNEFTT